jgi:hypothetical protein
MLTITWGVALSDQGKLEEAIAELRNSCSSRTYYTAIREKLREL